jgi:hypothetical protein
VTTDLDTLLIALYVLVDDHVVPPHRRRPGRPRQLSDAELVCLAVAQVLLGARSERRWLRMCRRRLGHLFPYLPKQPGYHKRLKAAAPLICKTTLFLATLCPSWVDQLRLVDATPIPTPPCVVRWLDSGHEALVYPGSDAHIEPPTGTPG